MFKKIFKFGKSKKTADTIGELKATESKIINSVNAELIKMHAINQAMYEICPEKSGQTGYKTGCNCCNECNKLKGVI